jgi:O-antigen/teichoic acid export membrane protein
MSAALPIGLAVFVSQGGQNISMLALGRLSSSREVGFYGAALGIAMMSRPLQMAYASAFLPRLSKQASEMSDKPLMSYGSGLRFALVFGTPIGIATAMLAPLLISIFYGQQFVEGNHALRVLGVATILLFLNAYLWQVHAALGNQRNVLITSVISILVVIGFSFLLIPPFGIVGAALAFVCREGVQALIFIMILHRRWRTVALRHQSVTSIVLASLAMAACLWSVRFSTNWTALIFLLAAVIVYCMVLLISGGIERGELRRLIPGEFSSFLAARRSKE